MIKILKIVVPVVVLALIGIGYTVHKPKAPRWYDSVQDFQISSIPVTELAGWIIEGKNDYLPIYCSDVDTTKIDTIPGLIALNQNTDFQKKVSELPDYKKWILITPDGRLPPPEAAAILTGEKERRVIVLEGGAQEWSDKIANASISDLDLSRTERNRLNHVRTFFHKGSEDDQDRYIAKPITMPPLLNEAVAAEIEPTDTEAASAAPAEEYEEEEEEEEGC